MQKENERMPKVLHSWGRCLSAALLCAASLVACASDGTDPVSGHSQPTSVTGGAAVAGVGTGSGAAGLAVARGGTSGPSAGRPASSAGMLALSAGAQAPSAGAPPLTAAGAGASAGAGIGGTLGTSGAGAGGTSSPCSGASADGGGMPGCMEPTPVDPNACAVGPIPADVRSDYKLSEFYTRYASADGTPIVSTDKPADEAIRRACLVVLDLSSSVPMARQQMHKDHIYFIMMAKTEKTVETPEYRSRGDLDMRARGFGNNPGLCAEENVMCDRTTDRWRGESICVHEYSHVMHLYVWSRVVPMFDSKVTAAYNNAVRTMGKYPNTYAASNATEYFAEGVQNWYNTNLQSARGEAGDGVHNHINTRAELKEYDPMLYDLLTTVLPDVPKYKDCYYYE